MSDNSKSKCHSDNDCSNHMNKEIYMFSYFTPMRREVSSFISNKDKNVGLGIISKSLKPTVELFWELQVYNTVYLVSSKICDKGSMLYFLYIYGC